MGFCPGLNMVCLEGNVRDCLSCQGMRGGRDGFVSGRGSQQQPKRKKEKEAIEDAPAKPWKPLNQQEVIEGARYLLTNHTQHI